MLAAHDQVFDVAFSPDGKTIASASDDDTIRLWNAATRTPLGHFTGHARPVDGVAFSPDGNTLASASDDKTIRLLGPHRMGSLSELHAVVCGVLVKGLSRSEGDQYAPGIPYRRSCPESTATGARRWPISTRYHPCHGRRAQLCTHSEAAESA